MRLKSPLIFHANAYVTGVFLSFNRMHLSGEVCVLKKKVTSRCGAVYFYVYNAMFNFSSDAMLQFIVTLLQEITHISIR